MEWCLQPQVCSVWDWRRRSPNSCLPMSCCPPPDKAHWPWKTVAGHWADDLLAPLNHGPTFAAIAAERAVLQNLGGGCSVPIAVLGEQRDGQLQVRALVSSPDGSCTLRRTIAGPAEQAAPLGRRLAAQLLADGARNILDVL